MSSDSNDICKAVITLRFSIFSFTVEKNTQVHNINQFTDYTGDLWEFKDFLLWFISKNHATGGIFFNLVNDDFASHDVASKRHLSLIAIKLFHVLFKVINCKNKIVSYIWSIAINVKWKCIYKIRNKHFLMTLIKSVNSILMILNTFRKWYPSNIFSILDLLLGKIFKDMIVRFLE